MMAFISRHKIICGILAGLLFLFIWPSILRFFVFVFPFADKIPALGQYGDSFGALTAIFTGAAFIVLCWTLIAQREELRLQREEMKESRKTFDGQKKVMAVQLFETTLFNLLQQHHQILSSYARHRTETSIDGRYNREYKGIQALKHYIDECYQIADMVSFLKRINYDIPMLQNLYYNVCSLIEHVENDDSGFIDKDKYKKIIRGALHSNEKVILCAECWQLKDNNMKSLFWDYIFGKQELEVKNITEPLMQEINTYFKQ